MVCGQGDSVLGVVEEGDYSFDTAVEAPDLYRLYAGYRRDVMTYGVMNVDIRSDTVISLIPFDTCYVPFTAMCYNPKRHKLYLAWGYNGGLSIIDCLTDSVLVSYPHFIGGGREVAIVYSEAVDKAYICDTPNRGLVVLDGLGDTLLRRINLGANTEGVYLDTANNRVYCPTSEDGLFVIDCETDTVVAQLGLFGGLFGALNQEYGRAYFAGDSPSAVAVFRTDPPGVAEGRPGLISRPAGPSIARRLPDADAGQVFSVYDAQGRRVVWDGLRRLRSGCARSGVYYIETSPGVFRKVVLTR